MVKPAPRRGARRVARCGARSATRLGREFCTLRTLKACGEILAALQAAPSGKDEPGVALVSLAYPWLPSLHPSGVPNL